MTSSAREGRSRTGRVCIVTPGYLSSTPRVVREADALHAAGFDVRVAFTQGQLEEIRAFDDDLVARSPWRTSVFRWSGGRPGERVASYWTGMRHRMAHSLTERGARAGWLVDRAEGRVVPELAETAAAEPADLFIGHYPAGLAAACAAAARQGAHVGYDVEDLYADTFAPGPQWTPSRERILDMERRYVPRCQYISAASGPLADAFMERYGPPRPIVLHNCHPWADRARLDGRVCDRRGEALSLFWFSQTVGLDRGIQDAIRAAGRIGLPVQIHLRGSASAEVRAELMRVAASSGLADRLYFHGWCAPAELLSRAAEHDAGLALETGFSDNNRLTLSNKLLAYLTAGLAVAATDLPGQRSVFDTSPGIGVLVPPRDPAALASCLDRWARHPEALAAARSAALEAARTDWNAEAEGRRIVDGVSRLFESVPRQRRAGA
jgi:glycosyltransferase involved in cell wall biosynthesis